MTDEILRSHVKELLERIERVFSTEWRKTKLNLDPDMIEHFVDPKGTFLTPESSTAMIPWPSRDELLVTYRRLVEELHLPSATPDVQAVPPHTVTNVVSQIVGDIAPRAVLPTVEAVPPIPPRVDTESPMQAPPVPKHHFIPEPPMPPEPPQAAPQAFPPQAAPKKLTANDIPKPVFPSMGGSGKLPSPGIMPQWPGIVTASIPLMPSTPPMSAEMATPAINNEPPEITFCKNKFAHLLNGVKFEVIRNFILAEATNTGMDKPTIIIYCIDAVWQEFAFDYDEGKRILNKYPQRDGELIEFIKVAGHSA